MLQVDNEGALYFRDGPYDQDYHPDAIRLFRTFLREKYSSVKTLREAWNDATLTFATVTPPVRFDAKEAERARASPRLDGVPRAPARRGDGPLRPGARERRAHDGADAAQPPARRGGDAAQREPHGGGRRPHRPRLLPPGESAASHDDPAAHGRARDALRGSSGAAVRRRGRRGLPAVLPAARRQGLALRAHGRDRLRASRLQPLHGGRSRSLGRRAHRRARHAAPARRRVPRAHRGARQGRASTRCVARRR